MKICIVMPTKNEEKTIALVIESIRSLFLINKEIILEKIIICDDSSDQTSTIAKSLECCVLSGGNIGLGYAMIKGIKHALNFNSDLIISMDSDGQVDTKEILLFSNHLKKENADLVIGSRFKEKKLVNYQYPLINRFGTIILSWILRIATGLPITDSHGGIRAMSLRFAKDIHIYGNHTYVQETIIDAHKKGLKIVEYPSKWLPRLNGKSRVVSSIPRYIINTLPYILLHSKKVNFLLSALSILLIPLLIFKVGNIIDSNLILNIFIFISLLSLISFLYLKKIKNE